MMKELLEKFENKRPEIVFEWKDAETEAEGWVVINSLRGGAAGGGTGGSGYGKRMLVAPEGTFALNNNDTIIAGTSLFKGDDVVSSPAGSVSMGGDALVAEMKEIKSLLAQLINKQGDVIMDSTKVGKALMLAGYQMS